MTVAEMIAKLQAMPQDAQIVVRVGGSVDDTRMEDPVIERGRVEWQYEATWEVRGVHGGRGVPAVIIGWR